MKLIVYGYNGWIGQQLIDFITSTKTRDTEIIHGLSKTYDSKAIKKEILDSSATHVLLATGKRNDPVVKDIDYLELPGKIDENIQNNIYGPATVAIICYELDLHLTYISDGAIYNSLLDAEIKTWYDDDIPNGSNSSYYQCIKYTDQLLSQYSNCLVIRLSFPISNDLNDTRNNYNKLFDYNLILNNKMSVTLLPCFSQVIPYLIQNEVVGTFNLVNSGTISQFQLRTLGGKNSGCKIVSTRELDNYVISARPVPILSNEKISKLLNIVIPDISTSCIKMLQGKSISIDLPTKQENLIEPDQIDSEKKEVIEQGDLIELKKEEDLIDPKKEEVIKQGDLIEPKKKKLQFKRKKTVC